MRTYVSPIGYDSTRVTRPLFNHGFSANDHVVLLRPSAEQNDQRADEAVADVERMLNQLEPTVSMEVVEITHEQFEQAVMECVEVLTTAGGEVVANFGGGARDVFLPFTIATLTHPDTVSAVTRFSDIDGAVSEIDLPNLSAQIPDTGWEILAALDELGGEATVPELTAATDRSKSTVTRHLDRLEANDVVETEMQGKTRYAQLLFTGRLLSTRETF